MPKNFGSDDLEFVVAAWQYLPADERKKIVEAAKKVLDQQPFLSKELADKLSSIKSFITPDSEKFNEKNKAPSEHLDNSQIDTGKKGGVA